MLNKKMCINTDSGTGPATVGVLQKCYGVLFIIALLCCSCAVVRPPEKRIPYPEGPAVAGVPTDEDLFLLGASYLGNKEITPDYFNARLAFEKLQKTYPRSRWRPAAQQLIQLIDEVQACNRTSSHREMLKILQENEKLKKDLERLRRLEIESEKRAKILK
jgi:hypothetical protein